MEERYKKKSPYVTDFYDWKIPKFVYAIAIIFYW